jgi:predicted RNA-binding Zn-ribbon protein involved in translation (DUF1610 family)
MGCTCGEILNIYNEYGLFSGTCPNCGETWGNPTILLPQDCFNIVKDYMGIVSVPTRVWKKLMKLPMKSIYKGCSGKVDYFKPFPKGTDLRKVSKKDKLQRYWCGELKLKTLWFKNEDSGFRNTLDHVNRDYIPEHNKDDFMSIQQLKDDFIKRARIFLKVCKEGGYGLEPDPDFSDIQHLHIVKPLPYFWGNFEATDYSAVILMLMLEEQMHVCPDNKCLGGSRKGIIYTIKDYQKINKVKYNLEAFINPYASSRKCFRTWL